MRIGYDPDEDRSRGFDVSDTGIVTVPKNMRVPESSQIKPPHYASNGEYVRQQQHEAQRTE